MRNRIKQSSRWVVKIGSSLLTADGVGLDRELIGHWCQQIATLRQHNCEVVLVSSGSIAEGMARLGLKQRPSTVPVLQAAAAVGQMGLVQAYENGFDAHNIKTAQVLLTHEDLANRQRYLNARGTLRTLLDLNVIPIVNENDTVTTDEIRFGDNDTLGALVANLISADVLTILTDQDGLFDKDPRSHTDATLLLQADADDPDIHKLAGPTHGELGRGGMLTKLQAAARAAESGTTTLIANGRAPSVLTCLKQGEPIGTMLTSDRQPRAAHKLWLANQLIVRGELQLDQGAVEKLRNGGASLLAVGVTAIKGDFKRGELVACKSADGHELARGLANYSSSDTAKIIGKSSDEFAAVLGFCNEPELINRDNMVLIAPKKAANEAAFNQT